MVRVLDRLLRGLLALLLGALTVCVFLQVLVRFVFKHPLPWTEEVARLAFVYSISVDFLLVVLPPGLRRAVRLVGTVLVAVFLGAMTWQGILFVQATGVQMTPVLQLPFRYLYVVIPASGALMLLYLVLGTIDAWRDRARP